METTTSVCVCVWVTAVAEVAIHGAAKLIGWLLEMGQACPATRVGVLLSLSLSSSSPQQRKADYWARTDEAG